jgi:L-ascorbate metabolism protein UlaG (beta-lactamase superfamily)
MSVVRSNMGAPVEVLWIGHAGILVRRGDALVAVDPFLEGKFCWDGNIEQYRGKSPWIGTSGNAQRFIDTFGEKIHAICITHAHGDHFDPAAIIAIHERNPDVQIIAPRRVIDWLRHASIAGKRTRLTLVDRNTDIEAVQGKDPMRVGILLDPRYPCFRYPSRVGYVVYPPESPGVAHLGDSHGIGPAWKRYASKIGGIVTWLRESPPALQTFFSASNKLTRIWLIHWESFEPGHFDCNLDPKLVMTIPVVPPVKTRLLSCTEWSKLPAPGENEE